MRRSLSVLAGAALAVALSQFPEYAQQYTQRLGGAVDELHRVVADFDQQAARDGLTPQQALAHYQASPDRFLVQQGQSMAHTIARYDQLSAMLGRIRGATPLERMTMLPDFADSEIGQRTLDDFRPAVPVTPEGLLWAAIGLIAGYGIMRLLAELAVWPFKRAYWRRQLRREQEREARRELRRERRQERHRSKQAAAGPRDPP